MSGESVEEKDSFLQGELRARRGRRGKGRGGRLATALRNKPAGFDCNVPALRPRLPIIIIQERLHLLRRKHAPRDTLHSRVSG